MKIWKLLFLIILVISIIIIYGFLTSSSEKPSDPPNWDNKNITYKIIKEKENYLIEYKLENISGKYFVGNSSIELDSYLNRKVKIIGNFPKKYNDNESSTQCINDKCHSIFRKSIFLSPNMTTSTIDINQIELIK